MRRKRAAIVLGMSCILMASAVLQGCQQNPKSGKVEIELVQYKPEAVDIFEQLEKEFNETHDDIHLKISSPNDATTILKTRFIREDYPDIIGIGGDINYSYFVDSGILADLSDYEGLSEVKPAYLDIIEGLEFVPTEGTYGLPYVANAAGVLYNKDMLRNMDGRFRRPGMNLFLFARRFRMKESSHFILDIKIPGPALHLGMHLQSDLHHPMFVSR